MHLVGMVLLERLVLLAQTGQEETNWDVAKGVIHASTANGCRTELEAFVASVFKGFARWDQVAVSVHAATKEVSVLFAWELYLPESWTSNPERLAKWRVPEGTASRTNQETGASAPRAACGKWEVARLPVVAYATGAAFRAPTAKGHPYVAGVQGSMTVWPELVPTARSGRGTGTDGRRPPETPTGRGLSRSKTLPGRSIRGASRP